MRKPQRTIKRVTDLATGKAITSDDLLNADPDRYQAIRRACVAARREGVAAFTCERCGHAVYAPRSPNTRLPLWRHHRGAPEACPWWTGIPGTVDERSAGQFQGAQESPLHQWLKHVVGDVLNGDPQTHPGSVSVDAYVIGESNRRRPDVFAVHAERKIAVEIQLSTTQLPIIDAREHFYGREGVHLIWVTWNFEPVERSRLRTAFEDIFYSHNKNIFSLDEDVLAQARSEGRFLLRVYWQEEGMWVAGVFGLNELTWQESGLPYAKAPPLPWHLDFLQRWEAGTDSGGTAWEVRRPLLEELIDRLELSSATVASLDTAQIGPLINTVRSIIAGRPVATRQTRLSEVLNTFFHLTERQPYARMIVRVVEATGHEALLQRPSTKAKLATALRCPQAGQRSIAGRIVLALFPDLLPASPLLKAA